MIHGYKRTKTKKTQKEIQKQTELSQKINQKLQKFFAIPRYEVPPQNVPKYLQFLTLLMQLVTQLPTVFNFRRQLIQATLKEASIELINKTLAQEIKLTTKLIQSDPKSYTIWSYRQWLVLQLFKVNQDVIKAEKELTKLLLMKDQKNFHVWNYRNWLNSVYSVTDEQINFTEQKIKANPFNFSPYHFRTKYINQKYSQTLKDSDLQLSTREEIIVYGMPKQFFDNELQKAKTAIFLNPSEQAPWLYYNWILGQLVPAFVVYTVAKQQQIQLHFNMKISDFSVLVQGKQVSVVGKTGKNNSDCWVVKNVGNSLVIHSNIKNHQQIKLQNTGRLFLGTEYDAALINQKLKPILQKQLLFLDEVIQSEEEQKCRFAYLQKSSICKLILQCGSNQSQFFKIVKIGADSLREIQSEPKAKKFTLKQLEYWQRLSRNELTALETVLKTKSN